MLCEIDRALVFWVILCIDSFGSRFYLKFSLYQFLYSLVIEQEGPKYSLTKKQTPAFSIFVIAVNNVYNR